MNKKITLTTFATLALALTACGSNSSSESAESPSAAETSAVATTTSASPSATATASNTASSSATASASTSHSAHASSSSTTAASSASAGTSSAPASEGTVVTLTVQTDGTAEFSHNETGDYAEDTIDEGFTKEYTIDPSVDTLYFSVNADSKKLTATSVACELKYNGKIIASYSSDDRADAVKATCGVTGDINTMAEVPSKLK